ncbi:hypothetical protein BZG36_04941 [Bifiguratus adelaidae]|uniref:Transcription initiation factor IIF subunit beta n=1 Tax=Bifiguratus adelaidae TaxID=1938954 RepID=A0A261XU05_9FUNG|nr:hypothetical protein BZG36_04941 [Bifiguratus adelaidae]
MQSAVESPNTPIRMRHIGTPRSNRILHTPSSVKAQFVLQPSSKSYSSPEDHKDRRISLSALRQPNTPSNIRIKRRKEAAHANSKCKESQMDKTKPDETIKNPTKPATSFAERLLMCADDEGVEATAPTCDSIETDPAVTHLRLEESAPLDNAIVMPRVEGAGKAVTEDNLSSQEIVFVKGDMVDTGNNYRTESQESYDSSDEVNGRKSSKQRRLVISDSDDEGQDNEQCNVLADISKTLRRTSITPKREQKYPLYDMSEDEQDENERPTYSSPSKPVQNTPHSFPSSSHNANSYEVTVSLSSDDEDTVSKIPSSRRFCPTPKSTNRLPGKATASGSFTTPSSTPKVLRVQTPQTTKQRREFRQTREIAAREFFNNVNKLAFDSQLPKDMEIRWSVNLHTTAGRVLSKKSLTGGKWKYSSRIELSTKVVDSTDKLKNTLAHELCHAASWVIDHASKPPHGTIFKKWVEKVTRVYPSLDIRTCHNYDIAWKYKWQCTNSACGRIYGRHSKSIDLQKHVCGVCKSNLKEVVKTNKDGKPQEKRPMNRFQLYVKEHSDRMRAEHPGITQSQVVALLAKEDFDALFEDNHGPIGEEDVEDLNIEDIATKVWQVKIPKFLMEKWASINEDGRDLGTIRIYNQTPAGHASAISLVLPEDDLTKDIPREYFIHVAPQELNNKYVFTTDEKGVTAKGVVGTIHHDCNAVASASSSQAYRNIMRKRVQDAGKPARTVQILGESDNMGTFLAPGAAGGMPNAMFGGFVKKKAKATTETKATRMPRNELMDILFEAFEKYPYWTFKGIVEHTKQPASYLKDVLAEIAILNKRGPYTSMYQLKPEFRGRAPETKKEEEESVKSRLGVKREPIEGASGTEGDGMEEEDEDMEDDDDEDMEMVNV